MPSILDCPETREAVHPLSVAFYHELGRLGMVDESVELLEGFLIKKRSKSPLHEDIVEELRLALEAALPEGTFIGKERPITTSHSEPEPDLSVILGERKSFRAAHPTTALLVIEVALNTVQKDRRKAMIYAAAGVSEYWLVEPLARQITIHRAPTSLDYAEKITLLGEALAQSTALPEFQVSLASLFA